MRCHVEFHAVRTVVTRSPGGRDRPQRRLVTALSREEEIVLELFLLLSSDILRLGRIEWFTVSLRVVAGGKTTR
jgi:hypothetical protein